MSLASRCAAEFESDVRARGSHYLSAGAVNLNLLDGSAAEAFVEGSRQQPYEIFIDWSEEDEGVLRADCTCPHFSDGNLCKHLWATLLSVDNAVAPHVTSGGELEIEGFNDLDSIDDDPYSSDIDEFDNSYEEESEGLLDRVTRQVKRASPDVRTNTPDNSQNDKGDGSQNWTGPFRELQRRAFLEQLPSPWGDVSSRHRQAWYVVDVSDSIAKSECIIDLFCKEQKKNGEYGRFKRLRFEEDMSSEFDDPNDRQLLTQLLACAKEDDNQFGYYGSYRRYGTPRSITSLQIPESMQRLLLPRLAATGRLVWMLDTSQPIDERHSLACDDLDPWHFRMKLEPDEATRNWHLHGEFCRGEQVLPAQEIMCIVSDGIMLTPSHVSFFETDVPRAWISWATRQSGIGIPFTHRDMFLDMLWSAPELPPVKWPDDLALEPINDPPRPCLRVREPKDMYPHNTLRADISFIYGDTELSPDQMVSGIPVRASGNSPLTHVHIRNLEVERSRIRELMAIPSVKFDSREHNHQRLHFRRRVLSQIVDQLLATGWHIEAEGKKFRTPGEFRIDVQSGIDWFDLDAKIDFEGVSAELPDLLNAVRRGEKYIELGDGSRGILPEEWLKQYAGLAELGESTEGKVRFKRSQALLLDALLAEQKNTRVDRTFSKLRERLRSFDGVAPKDAPRTFQGTLREYQRDGLGWFKFLNDLEVGGCLADDMGLGKTIQVLALLEAQRTCRLKKGEKRLPSLVVVPKSLIFNWIDEAQRFTPRLKVLNYTGTGRKQLTPEIDNSHLILTTYGTLRRDIVDLKDRRFNFVVLDEAQAIKNSSSQAAKASLLLQANRRLALTGTPIENHLGELWSLFEFLNPGMLGRSRAFAAVCKNVRNDDTTALGDLARAIAPFVLRRTKEQVLTELPEKTEQTIFCELSPKERAAYNELRDYYRTKLSKVIDNKGLRQAKIHVLEALLRLRQAACHLGLVDSNKSGGPSAKIDTLLEQLEEIVGEGHKALVFSQFTSLLAIVRQRLDKKSIPYEYLDGKTRDRKKIVDRFQQPDGHNVFLISLKAGGQGLNLTEADYVFILDPWWNPAVEMQAIDRVHRIGQTQPVFAYRIIARDTVEEKVLELQDSKRELANAIITANDSLIRKLTAEDLQRILS